MTSPWIIVVVTIALIAASAFFVAVEFALLAAKRHRLEDAATDSRSARAALRSSQELTLLLAGSQLGITLCTLALGAITKPAVHHWLTPLFETFGLPLLLADIVGFVLALIIVTFLHLVVGEMAPKSWAIAHPEKSATVLALPMRAFMWLTRPALVALNSMANWCLRRIGVEPADQIGGGQNLDELRHLVEHSVNVGALDARFSFQLSGAMELENLVVGDLTRSRTEIVMVPSDATAHDVRRAATDSGHLRILVGDGASVQGVIHVRDTIGVADDVAIARFVRPSFELAPSTPAYVALAKMRDTQNHLACVTERGAVIGVMTLDDVLARLLPRRESWSGSSIDVA